VNGAAGWDLSFMLSMCLNMIMKRCGLVYIPPGNALSRVAVLR
jgi:hypothetical protein